MRQKNIKYVNLDMMKDLGVLIDIKRIDTSNYNYINLEIGSGKGNFITTLALDNPNELFIAIEKNINVCYRIVEKQQELKIENLIIVLGDSKDILEYFDLKSIDYLFLNFSDPWPKARHHKRRLTFPSFLKDYKKILKTNGTLQVRTDHLDFFNDSVEYLEQEFNIDEVNKNYLGDKYYTEYEFKKRKKGKIYQAKGSVKNE